MRQTPKPHLILIGNYPPDRQASMALFAKWIQTSLKIAGWNVEILNPPAILAKRARSTLTGFGKWLGYLDKFILFPRILRRVARDYPETVFHVVDHSNALYCRSLPADRTLLTCHDVLAIEGALGDPMAFCPASRTGVLFQKWILRNLHRAPMIAFVSEHTRTSYEKLPGVAVDGQRHVVVPNGVNQVLEAIETKEAVARLEAVAPDLLEQPYYLHVGSALPRKNRIGILRAFATVIGSRPTDALLVFAGKPLSATESKVAQELALTDRLRVLPGVSTEALEALYNLALGLVFPSFSEGFGWPIIEAQSCGCPVIAGQLSCLPEIAGQGALLCDPTEPASIADAMIRLLDPAHREELRQQGFANLARFSPDNTSKQYARLLGELLPRGHDRVSA